MQPVPVQQPPITHIPPVQEPLTLWERAQHLWQRLSLDNLSEEVSGAPSMVHVGMWFGSGFILGFLFKKYFKVTVAALILSVLVIKGLEQQNMLFINWALIKQTVGIQPDMQWQELLQAMWSFAQQNLIVLIAGVGGFLIGHHLGG